MEWGGCEGLGLSASQWMQQEMAAPLESVLSFDVGLRLALHPSCSSVMGWAPLELSSAHSGSGSCQTTGTNKGMSFADPPGQEHTPEGVP